MPKPWFRNPSNWLFILGLMAICALSIPSRGCSRGGGHVRPR